MLHINTVQEITNYDSSSDENDEPDYINIPPKVKLITHQMTDSSSDEEYLPMKRTDFMTAPPKVKQFTDQETDSPLDEEYLPIKKSDFINAPHKGEHSQTSSMKSLLRRSFSEPNPRSLEDEEDNSRHSDNIGLPDVYATQEFVMEEIQKGRPPIPTVFKNGLKKVHSELLKLTRFQVFTSGKENKKTLPSKLELQQSTYERCGYDECNKHEYDQVDFSQIVDIKMDDRQQQEPPKYPKLPVKKRDYLDPLTEGKVFQKPVCKIVPLMCSVESGESPEIPLSDMTVDQLHTCLIECGLPKLAEECKREELDGNFLCSLDENGLKKSFEIAPLGVLKIERMKKGWRPKKK